MTNALFVTGVYRSGTTLLEKMLHSHPSISLASQPLPSLYFFLKKKFYSLEKIDRVYPINPDFGEGDFRVGRWMDFLDSYKVSKEELNGVLDELKSYKGQHSPELFQKKDQLNAGSFFELYKQTLGILKDAYGKSEVLYSGSKEIFCEEFTPYLLSKGSKVILILRDPRDIICSLNFGKGKDFAGDVRPLLYSLRMWRKSVAYAIHNASNNFFLFLKYEDLVNETDKTLATIFSFLDLPVSHREGMKTLTWEGNSSFEKYAGISSSPVGRYKSFLNPSIVEYIENVCLPELKYLKYKISADKWDEKCIRNFKEPFLVSHKLFDKNYTSDKNNIELEEQRIHLLQSDASVELQNKFFLFPEVYQSLKKIVTL